MDSPRSSGAARWAPAVAAVLTAVLLVAFRPPFLEHWDEVQFELGMRRFDLALHEPHPPGSVLFVLVGRVLGGLPGVTHPGRLLSLLAALAWVAMIGLHRPVEESARSRAAVTLSLPVLFVLSPTLLVHATTGRSYLVESVAWVGVLLLARHVGPSTPLLLGALVGIIGGFRPTLLIWGSVVMAVYLLVHRRSLDRRRVLGAIGACAVPVVLWGGALAVLSGGIARYLAASRPLLQGNVLQKSILHFGLRPILGERLPAMLHGAFDGLGPVVVVTVMLLLRRVRRPSRFADLDALLWGSLLPFGFYLAVIYDADGYSLSYVLPLLTWTLLAAARELADLRPLWIGLGGSLIVASWLVLPGGLASPESVLSARARLGAIRAARLAAIDRFPASSTLVVVGLEKYWGWSFRSVMADRPDVGVLQLARDPFIIATDAAHPYLHARDGRTTAVGPDGFDVSTLGGAKIVIFTAPKENAERIDFSCRPFARSIETGRDPLLLFLLDGTLRLRVIGGRLTCTALDGG